MQEEKGFIHTVAATCSTVLSCKKKGGNGGRPSFAWLPLTIVKGHHEHKLYLVPCQAASVSTVAATAADQVFIQNVTTLFKTNHWLPSDSRTTDSNKNPNLHHQLDSNFSGCVIGSLGVFLLSFFFVVVLLFSFAWPVCCVCTCLYALGVHDFVVLWTCGTIPMLPSLSQELISVSLFVHRNGRCGTALTAHPL